MSQKLNHQWQRVTGNDLDINKKDRQQRNESILTNKNFVDYCNTLNLKVTRRQAFKWVNKKGLVYKHFRHLG